MGLRIRHCEKRELTLDSLLLQHEIVVPDHIVPGLEEIRTAVAHIDFRVVWKGYVYISRIRTCAQAIFSIRAGPYGRETVADADSGRRSAVLPAHLAAGIVERPRLLSPVRCVQLDFRQGGKFARLQIQVAQIHLVDHTVSAAYLQGHILVCARPEAGEIQSVLTHGLATAAAQADIVESRFRRHCESPVPPFDRGRSGKQTAAALYAYGLYILAPEAAFETDESHRRLQLRTAVGSLEVSHGNHIFNIATAFQRILVAFQARSEGASVPGVVIRRRGYAYIFLLFQDIALENGVLARGRKQSESAGHIATVEYVDPVSIIPSESGRTGGQRESKRLFYKVSGQFFLIVRSAGRKGKKKGCSNDCA